MSPWLFKLYMDAVMKGENGDKEVVEEVEDSDVGRVKETVVDSAKEMCGSVMVGKKEPKE